MNASLPYRSYAVSARRFEAPDSADHFPTPPWSTRAFLEHILAPRHDLSTQTALEPAAAAGHMARVLAERFAHVEAADAYCYLGNAYPVAQRDFLAACDAGTHDWVITNPPFKLAEAFIEQGLRVARVGVAMLVRSVFTEGAGRYERLFRDRPFTLIAQYVERVPMTKDVLDPDASTATAYCWIVWEHGAERQPFQWIPPSRRELERPEDWPNDYHLILRRLLK